jgi:hypothetical protein
MPKFDRLHCRGQTATIPRPDWPARKKPIIRRTQAPLVFFSRERLELPNNPELKAAISGPWSAMLAAPVPRTGKATGIIWLSDHLMLGA